MEKKLILYLFSLVLFGGIFTNIFLLNQQCDPFISTTVIMGKCIEHFGNINESTNYIIQCSKFKAWQDHTKLYITYVPLSGVLTCMISEITNISLIKVCHFPLPYLSYFFLLYCILKMIYSYSKRYFDSNQTKWKIYIYFVLFSAVYSFIGLNCIGKFYVLEYHGISFVYILAIYYLLIKMFLKNNNEFNSKAYILLFLLFLANICTHYNYPLTITGGIILYLITYKMFHYIITVRNNKLKSPLRALSIENNKLNSSLLTLSIVSIILMSFQQFYYAKLSQSDDFLTKLNNLGTVLFERLTNPESSGAIMGTVYPYMNYLMIFKKAWHILFVVTILLITLVTIYGILKGKILMSPTSFLYLILIGGNVTHIYTYYTQYGNNLSLEIQDPWLLNSLILLPILDIRSVNNQIWKKIGNGFIACLLLTSVLLVGWTTFETGTNFGYNAFPYQVKEDGETLYDFIVKNTDNETIISGSIQSTLVLYEHLSYNLEKLNTIYPKFAQAYMMETGDKKHRDIYEIYQSLKTEKAAQFILTDYETKRGLYGGLVVSPLNTEETASFENLLENNENLIYNSKRAKLYDIEANNTKK